MFQGGGTEVTTSTLRDAVETAANRSLIRLFPKFGAGDNANWGKVVTKARDGAPDALDAVGHHGEPTTNAVCKEVLAAVSAGGHEGRRPPASASPRRRSAGRRTPSTARSSRCSPPATSAPRRTARTSTGPKELPPTQIGKVTLYKEDEPPTVSQRLAVRGLLTAAGIPYEAGQEGAQIPALLQQLKDLAARAGGPPPLPEPPDTDHLDALLALGGNQQFRAVADDHDRLSADLERWRAAEPAAREAGGRVAGSAAAASPRRRTSRSPTTSRRRSRRSATGASSSTTPTRSRRCSPSSPPRFATEVTRAR